VFGRGHERGNPIDPEADLISLPNVFVSPHIGGVTLATRTRFFELMVDDLERLFNGHEPRFELTPKTLANRRGEGGEAREDGSAARGARATAEETPSSEVLSEMACDAEREAT